MYIRWKKRERSGRIRVWEAGGALMVAYAAESKRVNGQPRQTATYLGSIRAGYCVGQIEGHLAEYLADADPKRHDEVRNRVTFSHITRRLLFWRDVETALAKVSGDSSALKAALAKTVAPITKREAAVVFRECVSYPDSYPKMLEEIGFTRPDNVWREPVDISEE